MSAEHPAAQQGMAAAPGLQREPAPHADAGSGGGEGASWEDDGGEYEALAASAAPSGSSSDLAGLLRRIDGKSYKAYKDLQASLA